MSPPSHPECPRDDCQRARCANELEQAADDKGSIRMADASSQYSRLSAGERANPAAVAELLGHANRQESQNASSGNVRQRLCTAVIEDLGRPETLARWGPAVTLLALELVRVLGRDPKGTSVLGEETVRCQPVRLDAHRA